MDYIGTATMRDDKTIALRLRAEHEETGTVGWGEITYAPDHAQYGEVLDHIGGLEPGEEKPVKPFPDVKEDAA